MLPVKKERGNNVKKQIIQVLAAGFLASVLIMANAAVTWAQAGTVTANKVNIRDAGSLTDSNVLFMVNKGQPVEILGIAGDYYHINLPDTPGVYIAREYVETDETAEAINAPAEAPVSQTDQIQAEILSLIAGQAQALLPEPAQGSAAGSIIDETAWIFETPPDGEGISVLGMAMRNAGVDVLGTCGEWLYINHSGVEGYVYGESVAISVSVASLPERLPQARAAFASVAAAESPVQVITTQAEIPLAAAPDMDKADQIVNFAKKYVGVPYVYGGSNPKGFDCSGFVSYVLKEFDISVSRTASAQAAESTAVDRSQLKKGDLLFFATSGGSRVSHVGMYIGDGDFIHASSWGEGVVITQLDMKYYNDCFVKATRVL
jgi:cell wall-associated NlpC family hydrolase